MKISYSNIRRKDSDYFYYLSLFLFSYLYGSIICFVIFSSKKKMKLSEMVVVVSQPLLLYFINRLYYSMCVGSLN